MFVKQSSLVILSIYILVVATTAQDDQTYNAALGGRSLYRPEMAQIPQDILVCYTDRRLWDR
jgi:hypothetical protein